MSTEALGGIGWLESELKSRSPVLHRWVQCNNGFLKLDVDLSGLETGVFVDEELAGEEWERM